MNEPSAATTPLCGAKWPTPCEDCIGSCGIEEFNEAQEASVAPVRRCMLCGQTTTERVCQNPEHEEREPTKIEGLPNPVCEDTR